MLAQSLGDPEHADALRTSVSFSEKGDDNYCKDRENTREGSAQSWGRASYQQFPGALLDSEVPKGRDLSPVCSQEHLTVFEMESPKESLKPLAMAR